MEWIRIQYHIKLMVVNQKLYKLVSIYFLLKVYLMQNRFQWQNATPGLLGHELDEINYQDFSLFFILVSLHITLPSIYFY